MLSDNTLIILFAFALVVAHIEIGAHRKGEGENFWAVWSWVLAALFGFVFVARLVGALA